MEGEGEEDFLLLAAGEVDEFLAHEVGYPYLLDDRIVFFGEQFSDGAREVVVDLVALGRVAYPFGRDGARNASGGRLEESEEELDERRLARAVWADESDEVFCLDGKGEIVEHVLFPIGE